MKACRCGGLLNEANIYSKGKASVFELWKRGTSFSEIARILHSKSSTIFTMLRGTGCIKPSERRRAVAHLTLSECEEIRADLSAQMSIRAIARSLNHSPSTIISGNRANRMAKRPKVCLLKKNPQLRNLVQEKLELKGSPEQISEWLRRTFYRQNMAQISTKTIHNALYFRNR